MRDKIVIIISLFALSSCGVYTKFATPNYRAEDIASKELAIPDTSLVKIPSWEEYFTDKNLQALIIKGLENNADLQKALLNIEKAEAMLLSSKLAYLPSFALSPTGNISTTGGAKASYSYNLPLQASWEIDLAGKLRNSKKQAQISLIQSEEYVKLVKTGLIASIANSYYTLLLLDGQLNVTSKTLANLIKNIEVMQGLKDAGMQTQAAVSQASANYNRVLISYEELLRDVKLAENSLCLLLNEPPHKVLRSKITDNTDIELLSSSISLQALSNRPDVKVAEYELAKNFYGVNLARAAFYPSITLGGSAGWSNNMGTIVNPAQWLLTAIGTVTQPIFNKGLNRANLKVAKAQYEQSLISFQHALLSAGNEVNEALIIYQSAENKKALRVAQIGDLQKTISTTKELLKHSNMTYLEVLFAENALLEAEMMQSVDWLETEQSKVSLFRALGGK